VKRLVAGWPTSHQFQSPSHVTTHCRSSQPVLLGVEPLLGPMTRFWSYFLHVFWHRLAPSLTRGRVSHLSGGLSLCHIFFTIFIYTACLRHIFAVYAAYRLLLSVQALCSKQSEIHGPVSQKTVFTVVKFRVS
jgi:hypothetical protein